MIHEIEKVLKALEAIMTEVDLELWQWQTDTDLLSLAGIEFPLVLHKNGDAIGIGEGRLIHDDGALIMSGENIHHPDGEEYTKFRASLGARLAYPAFEDPIDPLPLVMHKDGKKIRIGFAELTVLPNGDIVAQGEVTGYIPELHEKAPKFSMGYEVRESKALPEPKPWAKSIDWNIDANVPTDFREEITVPFEVRTENGAYTLGEAFVGIRSNGVGYIRGLTDPMYNEIYHSGKRDLYRFAYDRINIVAWCRPVPAIKADTPIDQKSLTDRLANHPFFKEEDDNGS